MPQLTDLPGVSKKVVDCSFFRTINQCFNGLRKFNAVTAAGDNGAINVWRDDAGKYRVAFYRRLCTVASETFDSQKQVRIWLQQWMPFMN